MKTDPFIHFRLSRISASVGGISWLVLLLPLAGRPNLAVKSSGETWPIEQLLMLAVLCFVPLAFGEKSQAY